MILRPENVKKSVDSLGRITLPKGLRDRFRIASGTELEIFTLEMPDGQVLICLATSDTANDQVGAAIEFLEQRGYSVKEGLAQ